MASSDEIQNNPEYKRLRKLMDDPRYWKKQDPAYVEMIREGFRKLYDTPAEAGSAANEAGVSGQHHAQDDEVAHVSTGEVVIPLSAQTPGIMKLLYQTLGKDMIKYTVGSGAEQRNPTSGLAAFADEIGKCPALPRMSFRMINETTAMHKRSRRIWLCKTDQATGRKYWEEQNNRVN